MPLSNDVWADPSMTTLYCDAKNTRAEIEAIHENIIPFVDQTAFKKYHSLIRKYVLILNKLSATDKQEFLIQTAKEEKKLRIRIDLLWQGEEDISEMIRQHIRLCDILTAFMD